MMPVVRLFSMVYGEVYIRRYVELMLPSLLQPGNVPALMAEHDVRFSLHTTAESLDSLQAAIRSAVYSAGSAAETVLEKFEYQQVRDVADGQFDETIRQNPVRLRKLLNRRIQLKCLTKEISACLESDAVMIPCDADCFFGDGSIANLAGASRVHNSSISALCLSVDDARFRELLAAETLPIANDRLSAMALRSLHEVSRAAVRGSSRDLTYLLGLDIVPLTPRLFAVSQGTPDVYAARFDKSDLAYFLMTGDYRDWDSNWPQKLISERRFRCLGSSDLSMCVNVMPSDVGQVAKHHEIDNHLRDFVNPRDYLRYGLSNETMRNFVFSVRTDRDVTVRPY